MRLTLVGAAMGAGWVMSGAAAAGELTPLPDTVEIRMEPIAETAALERAVPTPKIVRSGARIQCVPYARANSGVDIKGDAKSWWTLAAGKYDREKTPAVGSVIVMRGYNGADRGHVAVVRAVLSDRAIVVDHANWLNEGEVTLNVPVKDVSKNGDWSEVRVWHIPGATWGKRVYGARGFIRPEKVALTVNASVSTVSSGLQTVDAIGVGSLALGGPAS
ncbi:MAG: CHAP domain-containing protein [Alphaproteobacteria bacterium]|nr:CHAP domain-containing protein [Alphaproteobacteria bacterium]